MGLTNLLKTSDQKIIAVIVATGLTLGGWYVYDARNTNLQEYENRAITRKNEQIETNSQDSSGSSLGKIISLLFSPKKHSYEKPIIKNIPPPKPQKEYSDFHILMQALFPKAENTTESVFKTMGGIIGGTIILESRTEAALTKLAAQETAKKLAYLCDANNRYLPPTPIPNINQKRNGFNHHEGLLKICD